jgi:hypothetical protein
MPMDDGPDVIELDREVLSPLGIEFGTEPEEDRGTVLAKLPTAPEDPSERPMLLDPRDIIPASLSAEPITPD